MFGFVLLNKYDVYWDIKSYKDEGKGRFYRFLLKWSD